MRVLGSCLVLLSLSCAAQQVQRPRPKKVLTPAQVEYQQAMKTYNEREAGIRSTANAAYDAEMAREKEKTCPGVSTTFDVNMCLSRESDITDRNYKEFTKALRDILAMPRPQGPGETIPYIGPTGRAATPETSTAAFDTAEAAWKAYATAECGAVDTEWRGGTIVNSMVAECSLRITRSRMHELDVAYSARLHPY